MLFSACYTADPEGDRTLKDGARGLTGYMAHNAKYFVGRILSLLCCAALCSLPLLSSLVCQPKQAQQSRVIQHEAENGQAALTYPVHLRNGFVFSANLDLPEVSDNQSWYCVWLMVAEPKGTSQHPSMLQVGLIRWEQSKFQMQPFVGTEHSGGEVVFKPIAGNLSGYHRVAIAADSSTITLKLDGKALMSAPRTEFFKDNSPIYLKIAAEVFAVGDTVSGLVNDVTLASGADQEATPISNAAFEDRGLKFLCKGNGQWQAIGRFDPSKRFVQYVPPVCR